jgi:protein-lysine N-methyltransferase EEF2KMT
MDNPLSPSAQSQLDRFTRQYFQLEADLDFPEESCLRDHDFQQALEANLFKAGTGRTMPQRYQLRILKLLIQKIEQSIHDWDEEVCSSISILLALRQVAGRHFSYSSNIFIISGCI